jgi:hypothetical protein
MILLMEAASGIPYQLLWQRLLSRELHLYSTISTVHTFSLSGPNTAVHLKKSCRNAPRENVKTILWGGIEFLLRG